MLGYFSCCSDAVISTDNDDSVVRYVLDTIAESALGLLQLCLSQLPVRRARLLCGLLEFVEILVAAGTETVGVVFNVITLAAFTLSLLFDTFNEFHF